MENDTPIYVNNTLIENVESYIYFGQRYSMYVLPVPNGVDITPNQMIPFWTGFNHNLSRKRTNYTAVTYAPIIDAKPSDMTTVYTTMRRCKDMCAALGKRHVVQTMDHAASEVSSSGRTWWERLTYGRANKFWGDAGLSSFLVESGFYAASTADQMLAGKQFNRALRGLTLAYETLTAMTLAAFVTWCERSGVSHVVSLVVGRE